ncbi:transcriptional regulator, RpiR family [Gilliamella bombicola]|uniref:Transcriptional regulator, RpiR family n=1 Tax=Gilliamella bombicola TaxID=1798182 RepID=A0A1C4DK09_9GAMM|nr:SIS domain-containing protein [Gilliamella bombicola]SCC31668.1 transcriptional regulator, RpiR family [Gilliamella bombicola]
MKQLNNSENSNALAIGAMIRISLSSLSNTEQRIIEWMMVKGNLKPKTSIKEVAEQLSVSEPLLVKVSKKLGYSGFREIRKALLSYFDALPFDREQELSEKDNVENIIEKVFNNSVQALKEAQSIVDAKIISRAAKWIFHANRIIILGIGGSAIVGQDFEHKLLRIGIHSHTYSDNHLMVMVASQLKENDVVIAISQSGNTSEICNAILVAKKNKAKIICITNNHQSELAEISDLSIFSPAKNGPLLGQNAAARIIQLTLLDTLFISIVVLDHEKSKVHLERSIDVVKPLHKRIQFSE